MSNPSESVVPTAMPAIPDPRPQAQSRFRPAAAMIIGAGAAVVINAGIGQAAQAIGVSPAFPYLTPQVYLPATAVMSLLAAVGWLIIWRLVQRPARVLRILVPALLVVSFVPDLLVALTAAPGTNDALGFAALMTMHAVIAGAVSLAMSRAMR
ncbi:hypothetical protein GCM10011575_32630 [Microlunatus endophyticus]|uniref:PEP-CTERM protein-sorting domain-containing protein n=1 Tax=Microlunatus endophyticus TaxID=1716077 RepID=A0A917SDX5_9ACTN|nr:DUF6069 family protein [Microlunatus endophyticus]GGL71787.1 hypothetical protein GCM10011575_32630 [Microlunatus endophyticus]